MVGFADRHFPGVFTYKNGRITGVCLRLITHAMEPNKRVGLARMLGGVKPPAL